MQSPYIDSEIAEALEGIRTPPTQLDAEMLPGVRQERREQLDLVVLSDQVRREDLVVPGPPGAPDIVMRIHTPLGVAKPSACLFWIHGGGYIFGSRQQDDERFDRWCPKLGFVGVSVEYRLAPETHYPGALEDCYAGFRWLCANAKELGVDSSRIGIGGASAGGGLAAGLALVVRDRGAEQPAFQLLMYPMIDDRQVTSSSQLEVPVWPPSSNTFGWSSYLGPLYGTDDVPGYAAPARAEDLTGLPKALVCVGTLDGFCDEDIAYAVRLNQAGVYTELYVYPGAPHGFESFWPGANITERCRHDTEKWLASAMASAAAAAQT